LRPPGLVALGNRRIDVLALIGAHLIYVNMLLVALTKIVP
jgi:hypothetical protein